MAKRVNLSDNIISELEKMITGNLKPGDKVPTEMELAERFSVGRSTIRESMKALSVRGIVVRRNEGTFVSESMGECLIAPLNLLVDMEIGNVEDLLELRELLELGTIRIAAERAGEETVLELERINWQMQEPGASALTLQERDIEFHNTIAKATGNSMLVEMLNAMRQVIAKNLENPDAARVTIKDSLACHSELIGAIRDHDPERAYATLEKYFKMTSIKETMKRGQEKP